MKSDFSERSGRGLVLGLAVLLTVGLGLMFVFSRPSPPKPNGDGQADGLLIAADTGTKTPPTTAKPPVAKPPAANAPAEKPPVKVDPADLPPYLKGWDKPTLAFIFSGEIQGRLEPCGCSLRQLGGFGRRGISCRLAGRPFLW